MGRDATLKNASVNSGTAVNLGAANISYSWKNMTKDNAVSAKYDISETTYTGFENPTIVVQGIIPVDLAISNHVTQELLVDFATVKAGDIIFAVTAGTTTVGMALKGRPSAGYSTTGGNTGNMTSGLKVQINNFTLKFGADETREGQAWNYTINMTETI